MKRIILTALLAALPFAAQAGETQETQETCTQFQSYAKEVMLTRQDGISMSRVMEIAGDHDALRKIAIEAYERPRYPAGKYRDEAVEDFANKIAAQCYRDLD